MTLVRGAKASAHGSSSAKAAKKKAVKVNQFESVSPRPEPRRSSGGGMKLLPASAGASPSAVIPPGDGDDF